MSTTIGTTVLRVSEVFGPTIQGEGALAGAPTYFVRLGGCDYRCSWCDTLYAVEPAEVRKLPKMDADAVFDAVGALPAGARWVTISGGNPALYDLHDLVAMFHRDGMKVAVETQGSRWRDWLLEVDMLTVSPKPPSSRMASDQHRLETEEFLYAAHSMPDAFRSMKVVVFDEADYQWARDLFRRYPEWPRYISAGTPQDVGVYDSPEARDEVVKQSVLGRFRWLCEKAALDPAMANVRVLPQLHVLAWGTRRGV